MDPPHNAPARKLLVTGASGFIGRAFLRYVVENHLRSYRPIALVRPSSDIVGVQRIVDYPSAEPTVVVADYDDASQLRTVLTDVDVLVHLAADMDFFPADGDKLIKSNVRITRNLLDAAREEVARRKNPPLRFVYVSSTEVIGTTPSGVFATESTPAKPEYAYSRGKLACERLVQESKVNLDPVIVRPTGVFGPHERFFFFEFMQMVASGLAILGPSPLNGRVMFTHVDDVVQGVFLCASHPSASGTYNLCPDESASYLQVVKTLADAMSYPHPLVFVPLWLGKILMTAIAPAMNFGKKRVFLYNAKTLGETVLNREYSNDRLKGLGFQPSNMLQSVKQTVDYEIESGGIKVSRVPPLFNRMLQLASVAIFTAIRVIRGRQHAN